MKGPTGPAADVNAYSRRGIHPRRFQSPPEPLLPRKPSPQITDESPNATGGRHRCYSRREIARGGFSHLRPPAGTRVQPSRRWSKLPIPAGGYTHGAFSHPGHRRWSPQKPTNVARTGRKTPPGAARGHRGRHVTRGEPCPEEVQLDPSSYIYSPDSFLTVSRLIQLGRQKECSAGGRFYGTCQTGPKSHTNWAGILSISCQFDLVVFKLICHREAPWSSGDATAKFRGPHTLHLGARTLRLGYPGRYYRYA